MRFPLRTCACALLLFFVSLDVNASAHDPAASASGLCAAFATGATAPDEDAPSDTPVTDEWVAVAAKRDAPATNVPDVKISAVKPSNVLGDVAPALPATADAVTPPAPEPLAVVDVESFGAERASLVEEAYGDALRVIADDEECSDFFGGRAQAAHVLGRLVGRLRDESFGEASVGIRMTGAYSTVYDMRSGARYRLFEQAGVNRRGPFFREANGSRAFNDCGSFAANTREARAVMLLHELGHLMRGADGRWLLPNDGRDSEIVARNTARVEKSCGRGIRALSGEGLAARARR